MLAVEDRPQVEVSALEAKAQAVAEVLGAHKAFGNIGATYSYYEKRHFVDSVTNHATKSDSPKKLELTYPAACVRLTVRTKVVAGGALLRKVSVSDHPYRNSRIDYEELNREIQAVFAD